MKRKLSMAFIVVAILSLALATSPVLGGNEGDVPVKEHGLEKAKQAQNKHTNRLLAKEGVEGTAVGFNGQGQPTVVIFTAKKGIQGLPAELDGVPVAVRVTGKFFALAPPPLAAEFTWTCNGSSCDFDASSTKGRGKKTYTWDFDADDGIGVDDTGEQVAHTFGELPTYMVTLTASGMDGPDTQAHEIAVSGEGGANIPPAASFTSSCSGLSCSSSDTSTDSDGTISAWSWDFGDGQTSATQKPNHEYYIGGAYTVSLTVTDDGGASDTATQVVEAACSSTERCERAVPIGVSTGHPDITAGTIGARVTDGTNVFALSNNHIYANENDATTGDVALQPGSIDGGVNPGDSIGTLSDFEPIVFTNTANNTMDAAIVLSSTGMLGNSTPAGGYGTPSSSITSASVDMTVQKFGRTTKNTSGTVSEINVTVAVCYESSGSTCTKVARFVNQFAVTGGSFSDGGDSGSLIVTNDTNKNPVGLLFAGSSTRTIANDIGNVLTRFGVTVDGDTGTTPPPPSSSLSVTVTTNKAVYTTRGNVQISVSVADGINPVAGAATHLQVTTANGNILSGDATTDSAGVAKFRYKVNYKRDGAGTYTVGATVTKSGYDPGSGSTTFGVTN